MSVFPPGYIHSLLFINPGPEVHRTQQFAILTDPAGVVITHMIARGMALALKGAAFSALGGFYIFHFFYSSAI
jgi:hypothetical protein